MERVLVTGGGGFIGSHVVDNLLGRGKIVTIFDRRLTKFLRKDIDVILGDVRSPDAVADAVSHHDGVIHLAATLGTQETIEFAKAVVRANVMGSINVFEACRRFEKRAVYIGVGNHWMNNPYSITKTAAERFAFMYNKEFGTRIAVVRGLNAYGPRQKIAPVRKVVPNFVVPALSGNDLVVYGSGDQIMDMIYVEDLAEILSRALLLDHGIYDRVIEAGLGRDSTINELAKAVIEASGSNSRIKHVPMRPGEDPDSVVRADADTLRYLDLSVEDMTPLQEGIRRTVEWYETHLGDLLQRPKMDFQDNSAKKSLERQRMRSAEPTEAL